MNVTSGNRNYKVTSLFIKAVILIFSFCYIFEKISTSGITSVVLNLLDSSDLKLLLITFSLMFLNWGIEAYKWQILIAPLEKISFGKAFRSVFAGVTVSIFMPNRIGEFAGRIFFLDKADKIEATLKNFIGSFLQLAVTVVMGIISVLTAVKISEGYFRVSDIFNPAYLIIVPLILLFFFLVLAFLNRIRNRFNDKVQSYFKAIFNTRSNEIIPVLTLSLFRYFVFLFQFYLVLVAFGINLDFYIAGILISLTFLISSAIPTFAFTEVITRGAVASSLFQLVGQDPAVVITASLVVWIINLAIPALIGGAFISKLKFFKAV
jgi:uncharacterized membrane protein YbhN (UPF0104 family)